MSRQKILIIGDSPAINTGIAETIRLIFDAILSRYSEYYKIQQVGLFHLYAVANPRWPVYPTKTTGVATSARLDDRDLYGNVTGLERIILWRPDIVFAFNDPQHLMAISAIKADWFKLVIYTNFDGTPYILKDTPLILADRVVTMSKFALNIFRKTHPSYPIEKSACIYCPSDNSRFRATSEPDRSEIRDANLPLWMGDDPFVIGWVGRNCWRKQVWLVYKIIKYIRSGAYFLCSYCGNVKLHEWDPLNQRYKCPMQLMIAKCGRCVAGSLTKAEPMLNVFLWIHMIQDDPVGAWPTEILEGMYGVSKNSDICYTENLSNLKGLIPEDMSCLYHLFDILLFLSGGEGFGIPVLEAMSCGVPVVYTDYSAHAELLRGGDCGIPISGTLQPESGSCVQRIIADVGCAVEGVRRYINDKQLRQRHAASGIRYASKFDVSTQVDQWHLLFQSVLAERQP